VPQTGAVEPVQPEPRLARYERVSEWPLVGFAVVFLGVYAVDVLAQRLSQPWHETLRLIDYVIWALFAIDYVIRISLATDRVRYWWRHLLDLLIIVLPILRPLRVLRLVMLLRVLNRRVAATLRGKILLYGMTSAVLLVFCGALAMLDAERGAADAQIRTFGDSLWWATTTILTIGYGDRVPVTTEGRFVAVGLMISGVLLFGAVTASFATWLIDRVRVEEEESEAATRHDLLAVHAQLDRIEARLAEVADRAREPVD
jgi:voltage-gated potassium channel